MADIKCFFQSKDAIRLKLRRCGESGKLVNYVVCLSGPSQPNKGEHHGYLRISSGVHSADTTAHTKQLNASVILDIGFQIKDTVE